MPHPTLRPANPNRILLAFSGRSLFSLLALFLLSNINATAQRKPDFTEALKVARVSAPLTSEEKALAARLAEQALRSKRLFAGRKIYLTDAHMHRDTASERKGVYERLAVLIYYRYEGDLAIQVFINLGRKEVLAVKESSKLMPPISREEFAIAKEMALNHPQLREVLGPYRDRLVVEALTPRSESPKDPFFRHRLVDLLFRVGPNYLLGQSSVLVDLTTEKVIIEPVSKKPPM